MRPMRFIKKKKTKVNEMKEERIIIINWLTQKEKLLLFLFYFFFQIQMNT